jgi:antitoxin MazE
MLTQVQKWGNSLAVRIPSAFASEIGIEAGTSVDLALDHGAIRIHPVERPKYVLDEMLARITPENLHAEVDTGRSMGAEAW